MSNGNKEAKKEELSMEDLEQVTGANQRSIKNLNTLLKLIFVSKWTIL